TPPAAWFQRRGDVLHDYKDADATFPGNEPQRFVANYRKAGGEIALENIVDHAARRYGGQLVIAKTSFINFHRSVVTSRPYERNRNLRIDRKDRPRTDNR